MAAKTVAKKRAASSSAPKKGTRRATKKTAVPVPEFSDDTDGTIAGSDEDGTAPVVTKSTRKATTKKTTVRKPAKKTEGSSKKSAPKKTVARKTGTKAAKADGRSLPRELNEHGFVIGSNSEKILNAMLEGGDSRSDIANRVKKSVKSRNGESVNANALISGLLHRLLPQGYTVEQHWQLLPPTPQSKAKATRAAKKRTAKAEG